MLEETEKISVAQFLVEDLGLEEGITDWKTAVVVLLAHILLEIRKLRSSRENVPHA